MGWTSGPLGDRASIARFETESEATSWAAAARTALAGRPGILDIVLAYRSVAVYVDPDRIDPDDLDATIRRIVPDPPGATPAGRLVEIPVLYDGPDLQAVADRLGLTTDEVVAIHSAPTYEVFAVGFQPGFPYLGPLPARLAGLPRRPTPRAAVEAGSVAIAGRQAGIYPRRSPGGWHLLGRTPLAIVDLDREDFPIRAGDRVRFAPISPETFRLRSGERLAGPDESPAPGEGS